MGQIALQVPIAGQPNASEDPKLASNMSVIQTWANGNVDSTNISAALAQAAAVNQSGQTVKGATNIAASESRTNTAYGTLTTPDQVTGIVLPTNGLIRVWYQATWQESVAGAARAAIFIGANQLKVAMAHNISSVPATQAGAIHNTGGTATNEPLSTCAIGLICYMNSAGYSGDVTTGQAVGQMPSGSNAMEVNGVVFDPQSSSLTSTAVYGGPCDIFAAAGTYTISVQFKASSGSVTASNRKLWVQALSFS